MACVIAIHSYGIPCKITEIKDVCSNHSVPLIEDCAQTLIAGSVRSLGHYGDVSIFSYGRGKIIELGYGGYALVPDMCLFERVKVQHDALPKITKSRELFARMEIGRAYKHLYNTSYPDISEDERVTFLDKIKSLGRDYLAPYDGKLDEAISKVNKRLSNVIASRRRKYDLYYKLFSERNDIEILPQPDDSVPWRFNVWIENKKRNTVLHKMLDKKYNISSWYPDISRFLPSSVYMTTEMNKSGWLEDGVLNFWVDDNTDEDDIYKTVRRVLDIMDST